MLQKNEKNVLFALPLFVGPLFGRTCWTCLNPPLLEECRHPPELILSVSGVWVQVHRYCLKIHPKMCQKIIWRQKLWCRKIILYDVPVMSSWVPTGMGKGRDSPPPGNVVKCFLCCKCCLKSQYTKYFCIILRKCRQLSGGSTLRPPSWLCPSILPGDLHLKNYTTTAVIYYSYAGEQYGDRSFSVCGPTVWNSLPYDSRSTDTSLNTFKNELKTFLFDADAH